MSAGLTETEGIIEARLDKLVEEYGDDSLSTITRPHLAEWIAGDAALRPETWRWLGSTADLQANTYGYDLDELQADPAKLAKYVMWNLFAIYQETGEMGVEFSWAPWATDKPFVNRDRMLAEAVDLGHFIGNILVGMGVTDEEYREAYQAKQAKNRRRQESGTYSKQKGSLGEGSEAE